MTRAVAEPASRDRAAAPAAPTAPTAPLERLSARQREVLQLISRGQSNKEIAYTLGISAETARTHATSILSKLGLGNRTEAAAAYLRWSATSSAAGATGATGAAGSSGAIATTGAAGASAAPLPPASAPRPDDDLAARVLQRPAIAVLPIARTAEGAASASLAVALARELTTLLSRCCGFPVVAHAAASDPRALGDTSCAIGQRLGARFLVDGLLHLGGDPWRLTVHLIDASTGFCIGSERCDLTEAGWFAALDEVCSGIVAAVYPRLVAAVRAEASCATRVDLPAWQLAHLALSAQEQREASSHHRADAALEAALARDGNLVLAHFGRGLGAYDAVLNQWGPTAAALDRLSRAAARCLELAPQHAEGYFLSARRLQCSGEHGRAQPLLRTAIEKNPSFAPAYALLAQTLLLTGDDDEGMRRMRQACRLDPRSFVAGLAVAHFIRGEYQEARAEVERTLAGNPRYPFAHALAAACCWWMGEPAEAARHAADLAELAADFDASGFARTFGERNDAVRRLARGIHEARTAWSENRTTCARGARR